MNTTNPVVCHVTVVHDRYDDRIFYKECKSVAKAGFDVTLIVNDDRKNETLDGVKIVSTGVEKQGMLHRILFTRKQVYGLIKQSGAQICHLHDPELLLMALKLKKSGIKVVFDSHEFYTVQILHKEYIPRFFRKLISTMFDKYQKLIFNRIDAVVLPCTYKGKNPFEDCNAQTVFVNNYPLLEEKQHVIAGEKQKNTACYAGGITKLRGIEKMIEGVHEAKAKLLLAGTYLDDELKVEMESKEAYQCVEYLGQLNRAAVYEMYSKSMIGLSLLQNSAQYSNIDTLPTKVFEYMMVGLPVIISKTDYSVSCLKEHPFGIAVDPENATEIAEAINTIVSDEALQKAMAAQGKKAIEEKYNWGVEEKKIVELYKSFY